MISTNTLESGNRFDSLLQQQEQCVDSNKKQLTEVEEGQDCKEEQKGGFRVKLKQQREMSFGGSEVGEFHDIEEEAAGVSEE